MSNEELVESVLRLADADPDLTDDAKFVVLAALESDALLAEAIDGEADTPKLPLPRPSGGRATREPVGAFLKAIRVKGFRGVGPEATLPLRPATGLTVVCGRNGSGKSSFAEAFELALTGESYRWKEKKTVRWAEHWRNIHDGSPCSIRVELAEEGAGVTIIGLDWAANADLGDRTTWVQRAGQRREAGLDSLGWALPMELYRPMLSYDELGGRLEAEPSKLHDQLANILGLERITDAQRRVSQALRQLQQPQIDAKVALSELRKALADSNDARAGSALALVTRRAPDFDAVEKLSSGNIAETNGGRSQLQMLAELRIPTNDEVRQAATDLRAAVSEVAEHSGTLLDLAERRAELLRLALTLHEQHGDRDCPVCGVGRLDAEWRARIDAELSDEDEQLLVLRKTRQQLIERRCTAQEVVGRVGPFVQPDQIELSTLAEAQTTLELWTQPPLGDLALADHLELAHGGLEAATTALREEAAALLADRENAWAPLAAQLARWASLAREARAREPKAATVKRAGEWLKNNATQLRRERLAPLSRYAKEIWAALRQESNVDLGAITLEGQGNRRHVDLRAEVDGEQAGALGVMSQGELHVLALALFLPRATIAESPFRFVVLDDPIQAMDPSKIDGFVCVLRRLAERRQVVVLSHDDRLPEAVRRMAVSAHIVEVCRGAGSTVQIETVLDPAGRYLGDAFALLGDPEVPREVRARVLPGICRMAVEAAARDTFMARRFSAGTARASVEETWEKVTTTRRRVALALRDDPEADINNWARSKAWRGSTLDLCGRRAHTGFNGDLLDAVRGVERTVQDLRDGGA